MVSNTFDSPNVTKRKKVNWILKEHIVSYLFLLPALIFFFTFVVTPILRGIYVSFFKYNFSTFRFTGLDNYIKIFTDGDIHFGKAIVNTIIIVFFNTPIVIMLALFISVSIYKKSPVIRSLFRGIFYLPAVCSVVSVTLVWGWIYHPRYGLLNYLLGFAEGTGISWLGDERFALASIILVLITTSVGQPVILYVAALGGIPATYHEAAAIDGANGWHVFKNVTWPLLMPTTLYIAVITTINSFQIFSLIQLLTSGGPNYATSTIMYQVYQRAFQFYDFGMSAAMGIVLAVIIGIISTVQFRFLGSDVEY